MRWLARMSRDLCNFETDRFVIVVDHCEDCLAVLKLRRLESPLTGVPCHRREEWLLSLDWLDLDYLALTRNDHPD